MSGTKTDSPFLRVATVLRTKGVNGELLVKTEPGAFLLLGVHETFYLAPPLLDYKELHLTQIEPGAPGAAALRFAEITDRQQAHEACGRALLLRAAELTDAERAALQARTLAEDFPEQGYEVFADTGEALGTLSDRIETGANLVWVVSAPQGGEVLLPVIDDLQIQRDDQCRRITVRLLEGLLEANR
ncbi:MAG: hypothetical protein FWD65_02570 [Coriobacteriia bacterium]|nr:hypothetical protein [Coriobacteriia bacterium]